MNQTEKGSPRSMALSVDQLAEMAHILLTDEERAMFSAELPQMLSALEDMAYSATDFSEAPWANAVTEDALRKDLPQACLDRTELLSQAALQDGAYVLVPQLRPSEGEVSE